MGIINHQTNNTQALAKGSRPWLEQQSRNTRVTLLGMIAFTAVNIVLLITEANRYFLFSAALPYYLVAFGSFFSVLPDLQASVIGLYAGAGVLILAYLLCWAFWKKHVAWSIAALSLFVIDCGFMIWSYVGLPAEDLAQVAIDAVFHIWVLVVLVNGVRSGLKLRKLTAEEQPVPAQVVSQGPEF